MIRFREARAEDVADIVELLTDDSLGASREGADLAEYLGAFARMQTEANNILVVGEDDHGIVATYQISFISGLSLRAARRAQVESVRVASHLRDQGIGTALMADAEARARAADCSLMQMTSNAGREQAHRFYERLGFTPSHIGFKRDLT